jgi:hypothetical protein
MSALDGNNAEHPPNVFVPLPEDRDRWVGVENDLKDANAQLAARKADARPDFDAWLAKATIEPAREIDSTLVLHLPLTESSGPLRGLHASAPRSAWLPSSARGRSIWVIWATSRVKTA